MRGEESGGKGEGDGQRGGPGPGWGKISVGESRRVAMQTETYTQISQVCAEAGTQQESHLALRLDGEGWSRVGLL